MKRKQFHLAPLLLSFCHLASGAPPDATAYQITVDHAGVTTSEGTLALQETPKWSVTLPDQISYPIIADGRVFVTTRGISGGYGTQLHAFDAQTGARLWGPVDLTTVYFWSALTYENGKLFTLDFNGMLRSFDAATGTPGWTHSVGGSYSAPTVSNGIIYINGTGGWVYAIDATAGTVLWTGSWGGSGPSSPAVGPIGVYSSFSCQNISAYKLMSNSASGELLWTHSGPCSGGGGKTAVYRNGKVYARDPIYGSLILDALTGSVLGNFPYGPAPAIGDTHGYFLSGGLLRGVELATSNTVWTFEGDGGLTTAPIVIDQSVIVGSGSGTLYALNTLTGHPTWRVQTGSYILGPDEHNVSQPLTGLAIANGILVVPAGSTLLAYSIFGPPAPTGTSATGRAGAVELNWTAPAGAQTYNVYMGPSAATQDVVPVRTGVTGTTALITNLTPGVAKFFTIKAVSAAGISAPSNEASATPHAPAAPTALTATPTVAGTTLSWVASPEALSYNVFLGTTSGGQAVIPIATGLTTTGYSVTGLVPGTNYYYVVQAVAYGASSISSNEATAIPLTAPPPSTLTAVAGIGNITLSWSAAAGATSYNVYSGTSSGGQATTPLLSGLSGTGAFVTGLTANSTHYFVVKSVVGGVPGVASSEAFATVLPTPAPTGLIATAGPGQATLSWSSSATATSYNIYSCSGTSVFSGAPSTTRIITGLTPDVELCFNVKALGPTGLSDASNSATVTPLRYAGPAIINAAAAIGAVTLSWSSSPAATNYNVYMGTASGLQSIIPVRTLSGTSTVISGLTNTSIYYFIVRANTPIGASLPSAEVSAAPLTPPPPTNLRATAGTSAIGLTWSPSASATSYNVYMGTVPGGESSTPLQTGIGGPATVVSGLNNGTTYYFIVRAQTVGGLSTASNEVSGTPVLPVLPTAPTNLTASAQPNQVVLSWAASSGAAAYDIYMGTSSGAEAPSPVVANVSGLTATVSGLTNGTTYFYFVRAKSAAGSSAPSLEVSARPQVLPPSPPTNLIAMSGTGQVTLSWITSLGATSYDVYMGTSANNQATAPTQSGITGSNTTITGLTNGVSYFYVVKANNAGGTSASSNEVSAAPTAPPAPPASGGDGGGGGSFGALDLLMLIAGLGWMIHHRWRIGDADRRTVIFAMAHTQHSQEGQ